MKKKNFKPNWTGFADGEKTYKADCLTGAGLAMALVGTIAAFIGVLVKNSNSKWYAVQNPSPEALQCIQEAYEEFESNVIR